MCRRPFIISIPYEKGSDVLLQGLLNLDGGVLLWIQEWVRSGLLTPLVTVYTHLGDSGMLWIALSVLLLCFKKTRKAGVVSLLALLLSLIFTVLGLAFTRPLLVAIGVPEDVLPHSSLYLMIYFTGITFSLFYNMGAGVLRAVGDSTHPLIYLAAACMVNVVLDFLFVCGFHMGIAGAAIATVIAQGVSCVMVMGKLMRAKADYRVEIRRIRFHKKMIRRIISFGFPA